MYRVLFAAVVLSACSTTVDPISSSLVADDYDADLVLGAPPIDIVLEPDGPFEAGRTAYAYAFGAESGQAVLVGSVDGAEGGPCPPSLDVCFELSGRLVKLAVGEFDGDAATFSFEVPAAGAGQVLWMQALVRHDDGTVSITDPREAEIN